MLGRRLFASAFLGLAFASISGPHAPALPLATDGYHVAVGLLLPGDADSPTSSAPCFPATRPAMLTVAVQPTSEIDRVTVRVLFVAEDPGHYEEDVRVLSAEEPLAVFEGVSPNTCLSIVTLEATSIATAVPYQVVDVHGTLP